MRWISTPTDGAAAHRLGLAAAHAAAAEVVPPRAGVRRDLSSSGVACRLHHEVALDQGRGTTGAGAAAGATVGGPGRIPAPVPALLPQGVVSIITTTTTAILARATPTRPHHRLVRPVVVLWHLPPQIPTAIPLVR